MEASESMKLLDDRNIVILESMSEWDMLVGHVARIWERCQLYLFLYPGGSKVMVSIRETKFEVHMKIEEKGNFKFSMVGRYKVVLQNNTKEQQELYQLVRLSLM